MEDLEPGGKYIRVGPQDEPTFTQRLYPNAALACDRCRAVLWTGGPWSYPEYAEMSRLMEAHQCPTPPTT